MWQKSWLAGQPATGKTARRLLFRRCFRCFLPKEQRQLCKIALLI
jgi:hypothetical protein